MSDSDFKLVTDPKELAEVMDDLGRPTTRVSQARGEEVGALIADGAGFFLSPSENLARPERDAPIQLTAFGMSGQYIIEGTLVVSRLQMKITDLSIWRLQRRQNFRVRPPPEADAQVTIRQVEGRTPGASVRLHHDLADLSTSGLSASARPGSRGEPLRPGQLVLVRISDGADRELEVLGQVLEGRPGSTSQSSLLLRFVQMTPAQEQRLWLLCWGYLRQSDRRNR
jgi:hypothetical protein